MKGRLLPWVIVLIAAVAYPLAVVAGGTPAFPSRAECVHPAQDGVELEVVFGRTASSAAASELLARALAVGFKGSVIQPDGCGLLEVAVHGIPSVKVGEEVVGEARSVHLDATLEQLVP